MLFVLAIIGWPSVIQGQIVTDTLHADPYMHGGMGYWTCWDSLFISVNNGFGTGDAPNLFESGQIVERGFIGFYLPFLPDTLCLQQATLWVYQWYSEGNARVGEYPAWDLPGGDTLLCIVDHVDFGPNLSYPAWTAGDPSDPGTLASNIGILTDNSTYEWKTLDVTEAVQRDFDESRPWSQFRVRFQCDTDWDIFMDMLYFYGGSSPSKPMLIISFETVNVVAGDTEVAQAYGLKAYPNPFNAAAQLTISLQPAASGSASLNIYNLNGCIVSQFMLDSQSSFGTTTIWEARDRNGMPLSAGVYFVVLEEPKNTTVRRLILMK